jgi:UDP-N-acetylmuramate dehydrogenase
MTIRDHVPLREVVWFQTGGAAHYFAHCTEVSHIKEAVAFAQQEECSYCVIGKGTHILMSDSGYPGIVIQNATHGLVFLHDRSQVMVDAGFPVAQLVAQTISQGYSGLEFLAGLPGTVGGAVYNNQAVAGYTIGQYVRYATLLKAGESGNVTSVDRDWFAFRPHGCVLQDTQSPHPPIMLTITLQLSKMNHASCLHKLQQLQPQRPIVPANQPYLTVFDRLHLANKAIVAPRKPTAFLPPLAVEPTQLRTWASGDIKIFAQNPNIILNTGVGTSRDAAKVIDQMQTDLADPDLLPLIEFVGLWD